MATTYYQKVYDEGSSQWCYFSGSTIDPAPASVDTTPNWVGPISQHCVVRIVSDGVSDHGALTGLADDDHTQYLLIDGTRAMTGPLKIAAGSLGAPSIALNAYPTSGFYQYAANAIGVSLAGSAKFAFSGNYLYVNQSLGGLSSTAANNAIGIRTVVGNSTTGIGLLIDNSTSFVATSGGQSHVEVRAVVNQTASTAGFSGFKVNVTNTSLGSGSQYLIDAQVGSTTVAAITNGTTAATQGRVLAGDGAVATPGLSFLGQPNTGFYRDGTSGISAALGGVRGWGFTSSKLTGFAATSGIGSQTSSAAVFQINGSVTNSATPSVRVFNAFSFNAVGVGTQKLLSIDTTVNQVASSTGFTAIDIAVTETSLGSGTQSMISAKGGAAGTTEVFAVRNNGNTLVGDGSVAAPGIGFLSEGTGFYRPAGASRMGVVINGAERWRWTSSTLYAMSANSVITTNVADDALTIQGNATSGITEPALLFNNLGSFTAAAGDQVGVELDFTLAQTVSAGFAALKIDVHGTGGTGDQSFIDGFLAAARTYQVTTAGKVLATASDAVPGYAFLGTSISESSGMAYDATRGLQLVYNGSELVHLDSTQVVVEGFTRIQPGTLAAPGLTFEGDNNTGIYQPVVEQISIVCNGTQALLVDAASIRVASGNLVSPGIRWLSDSNSGLYFVTNGTWGLSAEGIDVARVKATVGGTEPQFLVATGSTTAPSIGNITSTNTGITLHPAQVDIVVSGVLAAIFQPNQVLAPPGDAGQPSFSGTNDNSTGMDLPSPGEITFMTAGNSVVTISDGDSAMYPSSDDVLTLGLIDKRYADLFAVQTTIGDLTMKDPHGGRAHLKLIEGEGTLHVYDIRNGKKYRVPLVEDDMTEADLDVIAKERARYSTEYKEV